MPHPLPPHRIERRGLLLALAALPFGVRAQTFDLAQLMRLLAQVQSGQATFTEQRHSSVLDRPVESTGRLSFQAPDRFTRETLKPRSESISVVGNEVTLRQGSRSRTVQLDSVPEAAVIVEAIRGTLTGNRQAIDRHFETQVGGGPDGWQLLLAPRDAGLRKLVVQVAIQGRQSAPREITISMADGDYSIMRITPQ
jgi:hypothetical protein